jgi:purine-binding chemotaxis protein CheW
MNETPDGSTRGNGVREPLARIESGFVGSLAPDQRAIDDVYCRRARQLAERQAVASESTTLAVLIFGVGTEHYAIELSELAEVFPYRGSTAVPGSPPVLLGVINVRGDIRCVADLRRMVDLSPAEDAATGYVVVLRQQGHVIGLRVDTVDEVREIDPSRLIHAEAGVGPHSGSRLVKALTADPVMLIDTRALLSRLDLVIT